MCIFEGLNNRKAQNKHIRIRIIASEEGRTAFGQRRMYGLPMNKEPLEQIFWIEKWIDMFGIRAALCFYLILHHTTKINTKNSNIDFKGILELYNTKDGPNLNTPNE